MWSFARRHAHLPLLAALVVACVVVWLAVLRGEGRVLIVSFLDVGQGDATFVETPSGRQMLIDGGSNRAVLRELANVMPWYDHSIDVIVATHPDKDHIGGLTDVLERYRVDFIIESSVLYEGGDAAAFNDAATEEAARRVRAARGDVVSLGDGVEFEILFPDRAVPKLETNTASVVGRLMYGKTAFMLTGDAPQNIEEYLVRLGGERLRADVLKAGHHGSKTSSSPFFVGFVSPHYVVYSRGCENRYGHPHGDIVALFERFGIETRDTCKDGAVTFISDGQTVVTR